MRNEVRSDLAGVERLAASAAFIAQCLQGFDHPANTVRNLRLRRFQRLNARQRDLERNFQVIALLFNGVGPIQGARRLL
ncbi:MAG: hypothetical protein ABL894_11560 [Hyphomicrobium sp.]